MKRTTTSRLPYIGSSITPWVSTTTNDIIPDRDFMVAQLADLESFRIPDRFFPWPAEVDDTGKPNRIELMLRAKELIEN